MEAWYTMPYVVDDGSKLANALGARTTPHVYLFNNAMELAYRGSIDDNVNRAEEVKERYLEMAMTRMAEGKKIKTPETKAVGCSIKRDDEVGTSDEVHHQTPPLRGVFCAPKVGSERDVAVLLARRLDRLVFKHLEGIHQLGPGVVGVNHLIHVPATCRVVGVGEELRVFCLLFRQLGRRVVRCSNFLAEDDLGRALGAHDRNLCGGPCEDQICPNVT